MKTEKFTELTVGKYKLVDKKGWLDKHSLNRDIYGVCFIDDTVIVDSIEYNRGHHEEYLVMGADEYQFFERVVEDKVLPTTEEKEDAVVADELRVTSVKVGDKLVCNSDKDNYGGCDIRKGQVITVSSIGYGNVWAGDVTYNGQASNEGGWWVNKVNDLQYFSRYIPSELDYTEEGVLMSYHFLSNEEASEAPTEQNTSEEGNALTEQSSAQETASEDLFEQMKALADKHRVYINFNCVDDKIEVTHVDSDAEYEVSCQEEFDELVKCFGTLNKFGKQ